MTRRAVLAGAWLLGAWGAVSAIRVGVAAPGPVRGAAMVATDNEVASRAGAEILAAGGNAADAAVAAALAAGVVQPAMSGLGGGGFAVWADGRGGRGALDFREVAPAAAHRDLFLGPDGVVDPSLSRSGPLAVAVPGEPRGLYRLLADHGTMSPARVAGPAVRLAREGFPVGSALRSGLDRTKFEGVRAMFLIAGALPEPGQVIRRPDLARALQAWVRTRGEVLAAGRGADAVIDATTGGVLAASDLAAYAPREREPIVVPWRGYTVISMAPPSSGGIVLAEVLRALEDTDLAALGRTSPDYVHVVVEAMKHAYADRARYLGDPDFVEVPVGRLLSDERRDAVRGALRMDRTLARDDYGLPVDPPHDGGTQHISVADAHGGAVALTTTINTSFGSGLVVPGYGVILNDEMDDFAAAPGVPNAFGLIGGEANRIEPGKRPLSSMAPTVVLDADGHVVMVVGAAGGAYIPSAVIQVLLDVLVFGLDPAEAVGAPRFHHQWVPDQLELEPGFPDGVAEALRARGHDVVIEASYSNVQVVVRDGDGWAAASDPRKEGSGPAATP